MIKKNFLASITKAEFDSALADFNARLTTFEAGINSKIDSQVSSYLDRNGIWNGKQQQWYVEKATSGLDLSKGGNSVSWAGFKTQKNVVFNRSTYTDYQRWFNWYDHATEAGGLRNGKGSNNTGTYSKYWWFCPMFECDKAGLLYMTLHLAFSSNYHNTKNTTTLSASGVSDYVAQAKASYGKGYYILDMANNVWNGDNAGGWSSYICSEMQYAVVPGTLSGASADSYISAQGYYSVYPICTYFVNKGDIIAQVIGLWSDIYGWTGYSGNRGCTGSLEYAFPFLAQNATNYSAPWIAKIY